MPLPRPRYLPRTIRGQLVAGTIALQLLLLAVFLAFLVQGRRTDLALEAQQRVEEQVRLLAKVSQHSIQSNDPGALGEVVKSMRASTAIRSAKITNLQGLTLSSSDDLLTGAYIFDKSELAALRPPYVLRQIQRADGSLEAVAPVNVDGRTVALAWVAPDAASLVQQVREGVQTAASYAVLALLLNVLLAVLLAWSVTTPLLRLLQGMKRVVRAPGERSHAPLPVSSFNEVGELTAGFNTMVRELDEQQRGLNDTLALLDSMLANAPVGLAFFDAHGRCVRINEFFARMNQVPLEGQLGRLPGEIFSSALAGEIEDCIGRVFRHGEPIRDLELMGEVSRAPSLTRSWLASFYPVRTNQEDVRWAGAVMVETTERRHAEEALRKTEKLAAAGRLAASIAHEINNPLEAVINLVYLVQQHPSLDPEAAEFADMAQGELQRVAQITQQTLRFYRQSTFPEKVSLAELLDAVLALHRMRFHSAGVQVEKRYRGETTLFAYGGELRQLFANLVGNALDAMRQEGGSGEVLRIRVSESRDWGPGAEGRSGVRVTVADTGIGMTEAVRQRIFEAFFTTKDPTGTGLGLWVSMGIAEKHGATIAVRSWPAEQGAAKSGSVFMVFLPNDGVRQPS